MLTIRAEQMEAIAKQMPGTPLVYPCIADFIEINLVDQDGNPVAGIRYRIQLPDSSYQNGVTDTQGKGRIEQVMSGQCIIALLGVDGREWSSA